jgi:hypothetical protein
MAEVLGIPHHEVMQVALLPVAYTKDTDFKPAFTLPVTRVAHWEAW